MDLLKNLDNMITAESFINQWVTRSLDNNDIENLMIEFAKMHVEAALKQAEKITIEFDCEGNYDNSILDCYSLGNIK